MARQRVSGGETTYFRAKDLQKGDKLVGKYVAELTDQFGNACWKLITPDGKQAIANYTAALAREMGNVTIGETVEVIYSGQTVLEKGPNKGKQIHLFEVYRLTGSDAPAISDEAKVPETDDCPF